MTVPDARLTETGNALVSAIGKPFGSPEVVAVLDTIQGWIGQALRPVDDGHGDWRSVDGGIELNEVDGVLQGVYLQLVPVERLRRFAHLDKLVAGVSAERSKTENRLVMGVPAINEYGLDKYLVGDGHLLYFKYSNHLQYMGIVAVDDSTRRRLERAAKKTATPGPKSIEISDEDGILALIDASTWRTVIEDWDFGSLTQHFVDEMNAQRGMVWRTGSDGYGEWSIELRAKSSRKKAIREATHTVEVTSGALSVVTYGQLTTAADDPDMSLADEAADHSIPLEPGTYQVRLRQLKNDAFEIELSPAGADEVDPLTEPIWWFTK